MMVILLMKCVSLFSPIRSIGAPCESQKMSTFSRSVDLGYIVMMVMMVMAVMIYILDEVCVCNKKSSLPPGSL